jgi:orotate phosphoribosyltransferase
MATPLFFGNYSSLYLNTKRLLQQLSANKFDAVVGVPRSGLLPATIMATALHVPEAVVLGEDELVLLGTGKRVKRDVSSVSSILVVEDVSRFARFVKKYQALTEKYKVTFACVYGREDTAERGCVVGRVIGGKCAFSWNLLNVMQVGEYCVDIDGVLCVNPPAGNPDAARLEHIKTAKPLFPVSYRIHSVVSNRRRQWEEETRTWLAENNIRYKHLHTFTAQHAKRGNLFEARAWQKATYFMKSNCLAFIESSPKLAARIAAISKKPVICVENDRGYNVST